MSFRRACLTPGAAVNRRFRAPNWHRKHRLMHGEWPLAATLHASGTSLPHPTYPAMR